MLENTLGSTGCDLFPQDTYNPYSLKKEQGLLFRPTIQWTYAPIVLHIGTIGTTAQWFYGPIVQYI